MAKKKDKEGRQGAKPRRDRRAGAAAARLHAASQERYSGRGACPKLMKEFGITNPMAVPRIEKVVLNMGMGEAIQNIKMLDAAVEELAAIAGQRPTDHARAEVDRQLQAARGHADRLPGDAARRRACGSSSTG